MSDHSSRYCSRDELVETFERVGHSLERPAEAYLIGGGAMAVRGTKDATKDIDLVTATRESFRRIEAALHEVGYERKVELARAYESLGATTVLKRGEDGHVDLFDRQVALKLSFSERMKTRAEKLLTHEQVTVYVCSPVDIALFKSMTPRQGDTQDVRTIIATHLGDEFDWETLRREFDAQLPLNAGDREYEWATGEKPHPIFQFERTIRSLDGVPRSLTRTVREIADVVEAEKFVILELRRLGETPRATLVDAVAESEPPTEDQTERALDRLAEKEVIRESESGLELVA